MSSRLCTPAVCDAALRSWPIRRTSDDQLYIPTRYQVVGLAIDYHRKHAKGRNIHCIIRLQVTIDNGYLSDTYKSSSTISSLHRGLTAEIFD